MLFSDAHCDTIERLLNNGESLRENTGHVDIKRMQESNVCLQFFAAWVNPEIPNPHQRAVSIIEKFHLECAANIECISKIRSDCDFDETKINAMLTIEGGSALDGKLENVRKFYDMGVRLLTLTWNGKNELGSGALDEIGNVAPNDDGSGLTEFGREVVLEMEKLGMIIDVSHLSERGFWDVMSATNETTAIFATHSNAKAIENHARNLTDEQIKAIIARQGFIGLNFYPDFLGGNSVDDIYRHAEHILKLGGENVLGFGADFDGVDKLPEGIEGVESYNKLESLGAAVCGENLWLTTKRVLSKM